MFEDDPRIDPADLRRVKFPSSFRGYEAKAVDDFLESIAARVEETNQLLDQRSVVAEPGAIGTEPPVVEPTPLAPALSPSPFDPPELSAIDDEELFRLVGEETAHVLSTARKAAAEIRSKAEESAARVIREATTEASRVVEAAEARAAELNAIAESVRDAAVADAEADAESVRSKAAAEVDLLVAEARRDVEQQRTALETAEAAAEAERARIIDEAKHEGREMIAEAKDVRTRVLEDLQRRRDLGRSQVERLAAGRDQLLEAYAAVRTNVDEITAKLDFGLLEVAPAHDPLLDEGFAGIVDTGAEITDGVAAGDGDTPVDDDSPDGESALVADVVSDQDPPHDVADSDDPASTADVDALFAKIRAERAESVARAQHVLDGDEDSAPTADEPEPEPEAEPEPAPVIEADDAPAETSDDVESATATLRDPDQIPDALLAGAELLDARAAAIGPIEKKLTRALKRHLADEQNEVLDVLRRSESTDTDDLLPLVDDHIAGYASVARAHLQAAADVGAGGSSDADVDALATALGATLVEAFRRRADRSATEVDGDHDVLDERLRALYREWKIEHIAATAVDSLLSAHALGHYEASPDGAMLRWQIDPEQGPCPDAQDNALAGPVSKGEPFPTGDPCPQAHPGCRCLLVTETSDPGATGR